MSSISLSPDLIFLMEIVCLSMLMSLSNLSVSICISMYGSSLYILMSVLMSVSYLFMSLFMSTSLSRSMPTFVYLPLAVVFGICLFISMKVSMVRDFALFLTASLGLQR